MAKISDWAQEQASLSFDQRVAQALATPTLAPAIAKSTDDLKEKRIQVFAEMDEQAAQGLTRSTYEELKGEAREIRQHVLDHLDGYIAQAAESIRAKGGQVHFAAGPSEVGRIVKQIAEARGAQTLVKSKSMASEEVHLNEVLIEAGMNPVETDLGEYIVQVLGQTPSHLTAPAIHLNKVQIAEALSGVAGESLPPDTQVLTKFARERLREAFLQAEIGISGANFVIAETGSILLVSNEGNARLVTALPKTHIAICGFEKIIPTIEDASVFLSLLPRAATGQKLTVYTSLVTGTAGAEADGPEELHVIFLDNGRQEVLGTKYDEAFYCVRCAACLDVCPVYRQIGGHAYGGVYSGPIGSILSPLLSGLEEYKDLPYACSLCQACTEACPTGIHLHEHLLSLRADAVAAGLAPGAERLAMQGLAYAAEHPTLWNAAGAMAKVGQSVIDSVLPGWFPPPLDAWAEGREVPKVASKSFRARWKELAQESEGPGQRAETERQRAETEREGADSQ